jgi:hypothetical protein
MKSQIISAGGALIMSLLVQTATTSHMFAADERTQAVLEPDRGPHGELKFDGKVEAASPKTHTISVERKAEVRPFVIGDQTKLLNRAGQAVSMKDFKKGDTVNVLYVASKGVWSAREIRETESQKESQKTEAGADKKAKK